MNNMQDFFLNGCSLTALASGALWWADQQLLCVSDLHLGKSDRIARRRGTLIPPYENRDTLIRLAADLDRTQAKTVICLGDSFDDLAAAGHLCVEDQGILTGMQAGRKWIWIEGNHDPGPIDLGGSHLSEYRLGALVFRHIAQEDAVGEVSGHYHPKARLSVRGRTISRACFLCDWNRAILPAYGTYTGGLSCDHPALSGLMRPEAQAILVGPVPHMIPMPRAA